MMNEQEITVTFGRFEKKEWKFHCEMSNPNVCLLARAWAATSN
jgi:hypothetical protein